MSNAIFSCYIKFDWFAKNVEPIKFHYTAKNAQPVCRALCLDKAQKFIVRCLTEIVLYENCNNQCLVYVDSSNIPYYCTGDRFTRVRWENCKDVQVL